MTTRWPKQISSAKFKIIVVYVIPSAREENVAGQSSHDAWESSERFHRAFLKPRSLFLPLELWVVSSDARHSASSTLARAKQEKKMNQFFIIFIFNMFMTPSQRVRDEQQRGKLISLNLHTF